MKFLWRARQVLRTVSITSSRNHVLPDQGQRQQRELESNAHAARTIYENFLQRYRESVQQQSFPVSEARLITPAAPPSKSQSPEASACPSCDCRPAAWWPCSGPRYCVRRLTLHSAPARKLENVLHVNCVAMLPLIKPVKSVAPNVADKHDHAASRQAEMHHTIQ